MPYKAKEQFGLYYFSPHDPLEMHKEINLIRTLKSIGLF
jgi:hypothetical protein